MGFPIPAQRVVFLPCPDRALFRTPFWGCLFFVDCGLAWALIFVVWKSAVGACVPSYRQSLASGVEVGACF
jgi:hypothetical protein